MSTPTAEPCVEAGDYSRGDDGTVPAFDDVNARLADLEGGPRDADPLVAERQDDRDRCAYRGDWVGAEAAQARITEARIDRELAADDWEIGG